MITQITSMKLCIHCWSSAIAEAGGCRLYWLTAGPPARSLTAHAGSTSIVPSIRASRPAASQRDRIVIIRVASSMVGWVPGGDAAAQRRTQFVGQVTAQLGANEPADGDAPALARKLDQRAIAVARLDAHPGRSEIHLLGMPTDRAGDGQLPGLQQQAFPIRGVASEEEEGETDGKQLGAGEGQDERRPPTPEQCRDRQRDPAQGGVEAEQVARRDRAVALQQPLDRALAGAGGAAEAKAGRRRREAAGCVNG